MAERRYCEGYLDLRDFEKEKGVFERDYKKSKKVKHCLINCFVSFL